VFPGQTLKRRAVGSAQLNDSDEFHGICVPRITMDQVELYEQIGQGAFGTVFRGTWLGTVKRITVKRMRLVRNMVIRELTVHSRVHHPNIVQLMAFAIEGSELNLISEYIKGRNLDEILFSDERCIEMSVDKKIEICLQILGAVAYLHNHTPKIIHREH
jgi:serine/threonine protein kinase